MKLKKDINYIVSGLERSGTSMIMQLLSAGNVPIAFDESRPADEHNPLGYYEIKSGKIINELKNGAFSLDEYKGIFLKITSYGLKFLPKGNYKIIYSERNIDEILDSMEKMANITDTKRKQTRNIFMKLNRIIKRDMLARKDVDILFVNYNKILSNPNESIIDIFRFLDYQNINHDSISPVVDNNLYRHRSICHDSEK